MTGQCWASIWNAGPALGWLRTNPRRYEAAKSWGVGDEVDQTTSWDDANGGKEHESNLNNSPSCIDHGFAMEIRWTESRQSFYGRRFSLAARRVNVARRWPGVQTTCLDFLFGLGLILWVFFVSSRFTSPHGVWRTTIRDQHLLNLPPWSLPASLLSEASAARRVGKHT